MVSSKYNLLDLAQKAIAHARKLKVDYADIRTEDFSSVSIYRENKKFEDISFGNGFGMGIR
ncbi:hypothetical protein GF374_00595, partial [Candidatus Woesearchaeota archaeon]|nr:hypothetical protein [Candidatus Woesearchaeota archaeon]